MNEDVAYDSDDDGRNNAADDDDHDADDDNDVQFYGVYVHQSICFQIYSSSAV